MLEKRQKKDMVCYIFYFLLSSKKHSGRVAHQRDPLARKKGKKRMTTQRITSVNIISRSYKIDIKYIFKIYALENATNNK